MANLYYKILKTFIKYENEEEYKVIQLLALSNKQFEIDIYNVHLWPEGWDCDDDPEHSVRFDDFFSADKHLELITSELYESDIHDPSEAVIEMVNKEEKAEFEASCLADKEYRKRLLDEKQARHDKVPKYEATCKETGERMVFSAETEDKALKLAEMYFSGGVLRMERVSTKVKLDEWDY